MFIVEYVAEFTKERFWKVVERALQVIVGVGGLCVSNKSWGHDDGGCFGWMLLLFRHVVFVMRTYGKRRKAAARVRYELFRNDYCCVNSVCQAVLLYKLVLP